MVDVNRNTNKQSSQSVLAELIERYDELLAKYNWDNSGITKALAKKLRSIKGQLVDESTELASNQRVEVKVPIVKPLKAGHVRVCVVLHNSKASRYTDWSSLVLHLKDNVIGRPIYDSETLAEQKVSKRSDSNHCAYVQLQVSEGSILSSDQNSVNVLSNQQKSLVVNPQGIQLEHIDFLCYKGQRYVFVENKLTAA